ncbi:MAG: c-type cytochrome biogenesis protein CcsB [Ornithinimicrobium sp.]|uniref:c-type cytochrome biogenesis protein CcsB n=1 Tax=Ornithinimicrobium sp. TaxID=1977084 RepID=UPI003D9B7B45
MTDQSLAAASDLGVWATMAALVLAMLAFAVHLAVHNTDRTDQTDRVEEAEATRSGGAAVITATVAPAVGGPAQRRWGVLGLQLTILATLLLVAATALRGLSVQRAPLGNMYEFALAACSFALLIYSGWSLRRDRLWLGLFVVTPVLLILGAARLAWYTEASQLLPSLNSIWLVIHVTVATLTVGLFIVGFATACLYLLRERAERAAGGVEVSGWRSALPGAAALERLTYGVHVVAFPLWTFTLVAGAIWAEQAWGRYWGWDPKEVWTFVIFTVYAAYLHARATTGMTTRRATWIAVAGFGCVIVNYAVVNIFFVGFHSYSGV